MALLQCRGSRGDARQFPATARHSADLRVNARNYRYRDGGGARPWRRRLAAVFGHRRAALQYRHHGSFCALFPAGCGGLSDAAARRRQGQHDRRANRPPVRRARQLAARLGNVVRHPGLVACRDPAFDRSSLAMAAAMNRPSNIVWGGIGVLFAVFLLSPLALVVLFAFTSRPQSAFPIEALSLRWWEAMWVNPNFVPALWNSLMISGTVGLVCAIVGTMAALGLAQLDERRARLAAAVLCLPLMLPPLVLGVTLLSFYSRVRVPMGPQTVITSHLLFALPFVVLVVYARLRNFDFRVVESARDLGASPLRAFFTVTLPIIRPTVVGAALIAMSLSLDDFVITFFTISGGQTLPVLVFGMIRAALTPAANAVGTLILVMTIGTTLIALQLTRYRG